MMELTTEWYDDNKTRLLRQFWTVNGVPHGEYMDFHANGFLWEKSNRVNGVKHGDYKDWDNTGVLRNHLHLYHSRKHGRCKRWWPDGVLQVDGFARYDLWHGEYKTWDRDGELEKHQFFDNGVGEELTVRVKELVVDIENITDEEKLLLGLTYNLYNFLE